jgi:hypothetical protein
VVQNPGDTQGLTTGHISRGKYRLSAWVTMPDGFDSIVVMGKGFWANLKFLFGIVGPVRCSDYQTIAQNKATGLLVRYSLRQLDYLPFY